MQFLWSLFFEFSPSVEVRKRSIVRVVAEVGVVAVVAFVGGVVLVVIVEVVVGGVRVRVRVRVRVSSSVSVVPLVASSLLLSSLLLTKKPWVNNLPP